MQYTWDSIQNEQQKKRVLGVIDKNIKYTDIKCFHSLSVSRIRK